MQDDKYRSEMQSFYSSKEWKHCRETYKRMRCYICERCGNVSDKMIVHHKIHLNADNVNIPSISLNYDNLELLCIDCHNKEHFKNKNKRYRVSDTGEIIIGE